MPFRWIEEQPRETEQDRVAKYNAFIAIIRESIASAVTPLSSDLHKLDTKLQRIADDHVTKAEMAELRQDLQQAQSNTYTKESIDDKLKWRDERLAKLEQGWATTLTRLAAVASIIYVILTATGLHLHF